MELLNKKFQTAKGKKVSMQINEINMSTFGSLEFLILLFSRKYYIKK